MRSCHPLIFIIDTRWMSFIWREVNRSEWSFLVLLLHDLFTVLVGNDALTLAFYWILGLLHWTFLHGLRDFGLDCLLPMIYSAFYCVVDAAEPFFVQLNGPIGEQRQEVSNKTLHNQTDALECKDLHKTQPLLQKGSLFHRSLMNFRRSGFDICWLGWLLLEMVNEEVDDHDNANDDEHFHVRVVGDEPDNSEDAHDLDDSDYTHANELDHASVIGAFIPTPSQSQEPALLVLELSALLMDDVLHLLELVEVGQEFAAGIEGEVTHLLHGVVSRMQDGFKGRILDGFHKLLPLHCVELLEVLLLAIEFLEDEGKMVAVDAVLIVIEFDECPESVVAWNFLIVMFEDEHIELQFGEDPHQKALDFVDLPIQRDIEDEGFGLHLYFYRGVVSAQEAVFELSLLLYHV